MCRKFTQKGLWIAKGFALGSASLVPGVSAGTIALIMGIYGKIIFSVNHLISFSKSVKKKESFIFLSCLAVGVLISVFSLAEGISWLLSRFPLEVYSVFTGLIIASFPKLLSLTDKNKKSFLVILSVSALVFILLFILQKMSFFGWKNITFSSFFISGFFGFFVSVLPGLSGSAVLLILGSYPFILEALVERMVAYLMVFLIGGVLGLLCAFYCVQFFLKKKKNMFFCIIIAFIVGSLPEVLPWQTALESESITASIVLMLVFIAIGFSFFIFLEKFGSKLTLDKR